MRCTPLLCFICCNSKKSIFILPEVYRTSVDFGCYFEPNVSKFHHIWVSFGVVVKGPIFNYINCVLYLYLFQLQF